MLTITKALKEASCLQIYLNAIDALDDMHFDVGAKTFFRHCLQKKDDPMNAISIYRYYQDTRMRIRNHHVMPFFPRDLATMKSGHGFRESCNEVFVKAYREGLVKTKKYSKEKQADQKLPPPFLWEYTKAPWYFGLAAKLFCCDPQLTMEIADVMTDKTNLPFPVQK